LFKWEVNLSKEDRIKKNVINLLSINKDEVHFDCDLGQSVDFVDKHPEKITSEMLTDTLDMLSKREPRASVSIGDIITITQNGDYECKVVIQDA